MSDADTLSKYGDTFQNKVVTALLLDITIIESLYEIISESFFDNDANKWIVSKVKDYYGTYKSLPTLDVFKSEVSKLDNPVLSKLVVDQLRLVYVETADSDRTYITQEFNAFCKNQNLKNAIIRSVDLLKAGRYTDIQTTMSNALNVGTVTNMGHDYVLELERRLTGETRSPIPTGITVIDSLTQGGFSGGELGVVVAPSGVGKTWILSAIGANVIRAGYNVIHYTLELSEHYVGLRYDTILTGIRSSDLASNIDEVRTVVSEVPGKLLIKYMPSKGITTKVIEHHLERMIALGNKPDFIIIDYADLLLSHSTKSDSTYQEQGNVYIELRGISGTLGIPILTASQSNRQGSSADIIEADKIADSYAKVMNADFIMSLTRKIKDKLNNTAKTYIMKNRFGPDGLTYMTTLDTEHGVFDILDTQASPPSDPDEKSLLHKRFLELKSDVGF